MPSNGLATQLYQTTEKQLALDEEEDLPDGPEYEPVNYEICCLLAEGSASCFVTNFASMIELYEKIADCFHISPNEIMYCTLNTPKVDMDHILSGQICLNDVVFVHRKGKRKHVEVTKTERFLGLTIADNGYGCSYIKKIKENSPASRVPFIQVGDHIESIMGQSMAGCRHYKVARFLKSIPLDEVFTIELIEPVCHSGYHQSTLASKTALANGKTVRIGPSKHVQPHPSELEYINKQLEKFIGINDDELAEELWRMAASTADDREHFRATLTNSELNEFQFTDDFVYDIWRIVSSGECRV